MGGRTVLVWKGLCQRIKADQVYNTLVPVAEELEQLLAQLQSSVEQRKALYVAESNAKIEYNIAHDEATHAYNLMYPRLQLTFPKDESLVESFFLKLSTNTRTPEPSQLVTPTE